MTKNRIRELRKKKSLTIDELAEVLSVSRATVNNYEIQRHEPTDENWQKLSNFFDQPVRYIQGYDLTQSEWSIWQNEKHNNDMADKFAEIKSDFSKLLKDNNYDVVAVTLNNLSPQQEKINVESLVTLIKSWLSNLDLSVFNGAVDRESIVQDVVMANPTIASFPADKYVSLLLDLATLTDDQANYLYEKYIYNSPAGIERQLERDNAKRQSLHDSFDKALKDADLITKGFVYNPQAENYVAVVKSWLDDNATQDVEDVGPNSRDNLLQDVVFSHQQINSLYLIQKTRLALLVGAFTDDEKGQLKNLLD